MPKSLKNNLLTLWRKLTDIWRQDGVNTKKAESEVERVNKQD